MKYRVEDKSLLIYVEFESHGRTLQSVIARLPLAFVDDISTLIDEYRTLSTSKMLVKEPFPTQHDFLPCVSVSSFSDGTRA